VTPLIQAGDNVQAVRLGDGWYTGNVGFWGRQRYGDAPAVLSQLECELAGGELQTPTKPSSDTGHVGPQTRCGPSRAVAQFGCFELIESN